jgi:hypothetical protein
VMAENYNAPGSPYWALKTFLLLALPGEHPFWQAEEKPLPLLKERVVQKYPRFILCRQEEQGHTVAFNAGYKHTNEHPHAAAKYEKFAYSNLFGFSVPKADWGLSQGAFDSMLAVSEGDNLFRGKKTCVDFSVSENVIYTQWKPFADVDIKTWLVAGAPWHVRIHCIENGRGLDYADGGFALGLENKEYIGQKAEVILNKQEGLARLPWGSSGVVTIYGQGQPDLVYANANTNLINPRTVIPTIKGSLKPGRHWLVNAVFGEPRIENNVSQWDRVPHVDLYDDEIIITHGAQKVVIPKEASTT